MNSTKENIIITACKLFLQKNFKEVTMKDIVENTGLSKGAFYHYFESKEELFFDVLNYFFTNVMAHDYDNYSHETFYQFYHDYAGGLLKMGDKYLDKFIVEQSESILNLNYFSLIFDAVKLFPNFRNKMVESLSKEIVIWTDVIRNARNKGEIISPMTDEQIAQTFIYLSDGVGMHMIIKGIPIEDMVSPFLVLWDKLYEQMKA